MRSLLCFKARLAGTSHANIEPHNQAQSPPTVSNKKWKYIPRRPLPPSHCRSNHRPNPPPHPLRPPQIPHHLFNFFPNNNRPRHSPLLQPPVPLHCRRMGTHDTPSPRYHPTLRSLAVRNLYGTYSLEQDYVQTRGERGDLGNGVA